MEEASGQLRWWGLTDPGPFRKQNEDAFLALVFDEEEVRLLGKEGEGGTGLGEYIFAVSDGMGGANAGEFASRLAVRRITERFPQVYRAGGMTPEGEQRRMLEQLFEYLHREMQEMGRHYEECRGMGATLSLLWLTANRAVFAHVGDSRIYRFTAGDEMEQVTEDHTHVGWLYRSGQITERQARYHPGKHVLQMALGGKHKNLKIQLGSIPVAAGDRFVLCTDGLIDGLWDNTVRKLMVEPPPYAAESPPAKRLLEEAISVSGRDNTTVLVVERS